MRGRRWLWIYGAVAAAVSAAIFIGFVVQGHWHLGLVYALVPVLFVLNNWGGSLAGVPVGSWLLLVICWLVAVVFVWAAVRESLGDLPNHVGLAIAELMGAFAMGGLAVFLTIGTSRMIRSRHT